jgi:hypothetical protein
MVFRQEPAGCPEVGSRSLLVNCLIGARQQQPEGFASWVTEAGEAAFGQSVVDHNGKLYLAAGGSDFLAEFDMSEGGIHGRVRDTSGSAQTVAVLDDKLIVGGHFYEVAYEGGDRCGASRGCRPKYDSYARPERRVREQAGHSRLLLTGLARPGLGPGIVGQLQPGVGAARRGAQAAHRRRVREGQRGGTELIRAALAGFAAGGSIGRREDFAERSPGTPLPFPLAPERIRLRRLSSRACAYYSRVTSVTPSCTSQGDVTPILIGVESVPYRTRYSVDSSYLFLR